MFYIKQGYADCLGLAVFLAFHKNALVHIFVIYFKSKLGYNCIPLEKLTS